MRAALAILVLAIACHGDADSARQPLGIPYELVFDLDLGRVVDDWAVEVRLELVTELGASAKSVTISPTGALEVTPSDPTRVDEVRGAIERALSGEITWRPCERDPSSRAVCFAMSDAMTRTAKKAALAQAVKTVNERLVALKEDHATAVARGQQIVVKLLARGAAGVEALQSVIGKRGRVELKVVDDGSDYMKRLYERVAGTRRSGADADPTATAAGIRAEADSWSSEGGSNHIDYYLIADDQRKIEHYSARLADLDPTLKLPDDRELGFERIEPQQSGDRVKWRSYYLERATSLTGAAIDDAHAATDPAANDWPIVKVELTRKGARDFDDLTTRIAGKKLATIVDGSITSAPVVLGPIHGGRLWIAMGGSDRAAAQRAAEGLAVVLRTGALPSPLVLATMQPVP